MHTFSEFDVNPIQPIIAIDRIASHRIVVVVCLCLCLCLCPPPLIPSPNRTPDEMPPPDGAAAAAAATNRAIEAALTNLKPLRDLAQNWDIDIATW